MQNVLQTVVSQYGNSPVLLGLINRFNAAVDPSTNFDNFYNDIWNLQTASGIGLDIWGRIVGVSRALQITEARWEGFSQQTTLTSDPFGFSPLYSGQQLLFPYNLSDTDFLTLIYAKARSNIWDGSIPGLNAIMMSMFPGSGNCYVVDGLNMTLTYTYEFALTSVQAAVVFQSGILPRPAGVLALYSFQGSMTVDTTPQPFVLDVSHLDSTDVLT